MKKVNRGSVTIVMDGQAGSCGKGKTIGYLALRDMPSAAINNFMSNAGHTFEADDGRRVMTQHLPTSIVSRETQLLIGPGAAITMDILFDEIRKYSRLNGQIHSDLLGNRRIFIHPNAAVITEAHREKERQMIRSGSTFKGCGVAQAEKAMRSPDVRLFGDVMIPREFDDYIQITDTGLVINNLIDNGGNVLIEGSQGFDLDINYGIEYPHVTSRQCNAGQLVADCGISPMLVDDIYMVIRPYPIRISNQTDIGVDCCSGQYGGSKEITWDTVKSRCGAPDDVQFGEKTTVTKKTRRVFEMNWERLQYAVKINRPTKICLNFAQYIDYDAYCSTTWNAMPSRVRKFIDEVERRTNVPVTLIGTGPANMHMVDLDKI